MKLSVDTFLRRSLIGGIVLILALIPFHAFLTVWIASGADHYTAIRLWKEAVLAILSISTIWFLVRHPLFAKDVARHNTLRLLSIYVGAYIVLTILLGLFALQQGKVQSLAVAYSYISNLRFLIFFGVCLVAAVHFKGFFKKYWQPLLLAPAALVVAFGLLQFLILPHDILRHVGYGPDTIKPYIAVDNKIEFVRAQSTLRGPNPLGAYLVVVIAALTSLVVMRKQRYVATALIVTLVVLFGTYSRSAWLGALIAMIVIGLLLLRSRARRNMCIAMAAIALIGLSLIFALRNNDTVQNVVFHTDETSQSQTSSNEDRASGLLGGFGDVIAEPFGRGPGTAGPASAYNDTARISENYFLQIGQETGLVGLGLFIAICGLVGKLLWDIRRQSLLPVVLLASLAGLTLVNLLSHAWADDTLAYIWWGFAGLAIGMHLFDSKKSKRT